MNSLVSSADKSRLPASDRFIPRLLSRMRFQVPGILLFGVLLPAVLVQHIQQGAPLTTDYDYVDLGSFLAVIGGYLIFRKMSVIPGTKTYLSVFPALAFAFIFTSALLMMLKLPFGRTQMLLSFAGALTFLYAVQILIYRFTPLRIGIVPGGETADLTSVTGAQWVPFNSPEEAERHPHLPLVADLHSSDLSDTWERYIAETAVQGRRVFNMRQLRESLEGKVQMEYLSENTMGHLTLDSVYVPFKRSFDFISAFLFLIIFSPLLLLTALIIKIDSPGPAIFRQTRMGYRGKEFTVWKFRSMTHRTEGEASTDDDMTRDNDQRITRVGKFIRKTRIDELPQIINILRGEMSWIGPRPETLNLSQWYENEIPFYRYRHVVRPGISGWAQTQQGHVTTIQDVRTKLYYDFYYIKNFSVWLDALIVLKTIRVVLTGHGAK